MNGPPPDAMLVDFRLPEGVDGVSVIATLRKTLGADVPAIIVSGESSSPGLAHIERSGFLLMHKPIAASKLRAELSHLLSHTVHAAG